MIFTKPVAGARVAAIFTAEVDGGDAEVLLMPPSRSERRSLASYTGSPNMDEHFDSAAFIFSDDSYRDITSELAANPFNRKIAEMGPVLAEKWNSTARNITNSFETRLDARPAFRRPSARTAGFFAAALRGKKPAISTSPTIPGRRSRCWSARWLIAITGRISISGPASRRSPSATASSARRRNASLLHDYRIEATLDADSGAACGDQGQAEAPRTPATWSFRSRSRRGCG